MQLGILSDTHNHLGNLKKALDTFRAAGATTLVHCGDLTEPSVAAHLGDFTVIYVSGNMDAARPELRQAIQAQNEASVVAAVYTGVIDDVPLAAAHGHVPGQLEELIGSGRYRYVLHGHTHTRRDEMVGKTRVINPGALGGMRHQSRSIGLLDLESGVFEFVEVAVW